MRREWQTNWQRPAAVAVRRRSNAELLRLYLDALERRSAPTNTIRNRTLQLNAFLRAVDACDHVTDLTDRDLEAYAWAYAKKCRKFHSRSAKKDGEATCGAGITVSACPMLNGGDPAACRQYEAIRPETVLVHMNHLGSFYRFLHEEGYNHHNPADVARRRFMRATKKQRQRHRQSNRKRLLTREEIVRLYRTSPIWRGTLYFLCAKWGLRIHEALGLTMEPPYWTPDEGYVRLPEQNPYGEKRQGNDILPLDAELRYVLGRYLLWREANVARGPDGNACTTRLLLNGQQGQAWSETYGPHRLNERLRTDARRTGVESAGDPRGRVTTHCFRVFFVTSLENNRCPSDWVKMLKGDLLPGSIHPYFHPAKIRDVYDEYAPRLLTAT